MSRNQELLTEARAIHERHPSVDLHADPLLWARMVGYDLTKRHRNRLPGSSFFFHSDLPRWQEVNLRLAILGIVTLPSPTRAGYFRQAEETLRRAEAVVFRSKREFRLVKDEASFNDAVNGRCVGGLMSLEGAQPLEGKLDRLDDLGGRGLRAVGLAHFHRNEATSPGWGPGGDRGPFSKPKLSAEGLTDFGRELVARCNEKRLLIDLAHASRAGFMEAAKISERPVFVSHTGVRGAHDHWRNIDDEQLRAVATSGGVVGIIFARMFVGGKGIDALVRHIEHVIDTIGEDHVALGSDFDGMIVPVRGLADIASLPNLTAALLERGHSEERIAALLGGNALRFIRRAMFE